MGVSNCHASWLRDRVAAAPASEPPDPIVCRATGDTPAQTLGAHACSQTAMAHARLAFAPCTPVTDSARSSARGRRGCDNGN
jgi:hypothetical protein